MMETTQDYFIYYYLNNNIAYFMQQLWREDEDIGNNFEYLMNTVKATKNLIDGIVLHREEDFLVKVKYIYSLIINYLQLTACHSQLGDHNIALKQGIKCIKYFHHMSILLLDLIKGQKQEYLTPEIESFKHFLFYINRVNQFALGLLEYKNFMGMNMFETFDKIVLDYAAD